MKRLNSIWVWLMVFCPAAAVIAQSPAEKPIWLVITRPMFRNALMPLLQMRKADGYDAMISTDLPAKAVSDSLRPPAAILLVGDDQPGQERQGWYLPGIRQNLYRWRRDQKPTYVSDMLYGDLDKDSVIDIPVGRLPVRDVESLDKLIRRIQAYESRPPALSDLQLVVWAGSANYNPIVDNLSTVLLINSVNQLLPHWVSPFVLAANTTSPFCGWPVDEPDHFIEQLQAGAMMGLFIGHAERDALYVMYFEGTHVFLNSSKLDQRHNPVRPLPPLLLSTCSVGDFADEKPCLSESLMSMSAGPPAVISPGAESHPLPNCYMCLSYSEELDKGHATIGELFLAVQKRTLSYREVFLEMILKDVEGKLEEDINTSQLQQDHHLMYNIMGDPAMKLKLPKPLSGSLSIEDGVAQWKAEKPEDADRLMVTFREKYQAAPAVQWPLEKDSANLTLRQANKVYGFETLEIIQNADSWSGRMAKNGILRLVAVGPTGLYVKTFVINIPKPAVESNATIQ